ncbi:BlaI/MecI/CopY family transcriptional regulator [Clostridiaceae bacterium M8S5]|nr:BlaI/MecI/CopY family transcriptional regulator [Clostridiaceae bacterium M8S5]
MRKLPQITDSEWLIMQVLWYNPPHTSSDIMKQLSAKTNWKPTTIKTLLSRLVKKSIITYEVKNRAYYYSPLLNKEECVRAENKSFLQKIYGGALKPMIANFLETEHLTKEDIRELKKILDEKDKER